MLHGNVLMADLDVDQWRNAQDLVLKSAKEAKRLIVMLEGGEVVKCRHTTGRAVDQAPTSVEDLNAAAHALYDANKEDPDFVLVMERDAADEYFARYQNAWNAEQDLDEYVHKTYASLDDFADRIVTYPSPARETLGLQWRIGATFEELEGAVRSLVAPGSTVLLAVHDGEKLWTSLILSFDADLKIISIGTADPSLVDIHGLRADVVERLVRFADAREGNVGLVVEATLHAAKEFLAATNKKAVRARLGDALVVTER